MTSSFTKYLKYVMELRGVERICGLLRFRYQSEDAAIRAKWIVEDMAAINFNINICISTYAERLFYQELPFPIEYELSAKEWSINSTRYRSAMEGTHLTRGDLFYLAKICKIAREISDLGWPNSFGPELNNPSGHISTLTEIWWLGRFIMPRNVIRNYQIVGSNGDVDWRFECGPLGCPVVVNLEVKRRPSDLANLFDTSESSLFAKVEKKFPDRGRWICDQSDLNIVAITIYSDIDKQLTKRVENWLETHKSIDMVLLFSFKGDKEIQWRTIPSKHDVAFGSLCMKDPDSEDLSSIAVLTHLNFDLAEELGLPFMKS